jgi:hypothetical protein
MSALAVNSGTGRIRARTPSWGAPQASERPMTVFVYIDTAKQLGDVDYVKVFANVECCRKVA